MKIIINFLTIALIASVFVACESDPQVDVGPRGIGVAATIESVESAFFDEGDKDNTFVKFTIGLPEGTTNVSSSMLQISKNGSAERVSLGSYSSFPAVIILTLADVADALGISLDDITGGDVINVEVLTEVSGEYYRSNTALNPPVACTYDPAFISGTYDITSSSWGSSGVVTITPHADDIYKFDVVGLAAMDGVNEDQGPLVFIVNPDDYSVTAPATVLATAAFGYDNYTYASSAPGSINTCNGTYNMAFEITVTQGSFGTYSDYIFTKK